MCLAEIWIESKNGPVSRCFDRAPIEGFHLPFVQIEMLNARLGADCLLRWTHKLLRSQSITNDDASKFPSIYLILSALFFSPDAPPPQIFQILGLHWRAVSYHGDAGLVIYRRIRCLLLHIGADAGLSHAPFSLLFSRSFRGQCAHSHSTESISFAPRVSLASPARNTRRSRSLQSTACSGHFSISGHRPKAYTVLVLCLRVTTEKQVSTRCAPRTRLRKGCHGSIRSVLLTQLPNPHITLVYPTIIRSGMETVPGSHAWRCVGEHPVVHPPPRLLPQDMSPSEGETLSTAGSTSTDHPVLPSSEPLPLQILDQRVQQHWSCL